MLKCACRAAFGGGAGSLTSPCRIKKDKVTTVNGNNCDSAFTLAEVLITLGIIGIVAAMTLPSVIVNYQKQEALTRLKKSYTTVANALVTAVSEHGDVDTWNWDEPESIIKNYLAPNWTGIEIYNGDCRYGTCYCMNKDPNRNQPAVGKYGSYDWPGGQGITSPMPSRVPSVLFMDGSCVIFGKYFEQNTVWIDINGTYKGDNKVGKDLFTFIIDKKGKLTEWNSYGWCEEGFNNQPSASGLNCGSKIIQDSWQITYPW